MFKEMTVTLPRATNWHLSCTFLHFGADVHHLVSALGPGGSLHTFRFNLNIFDAPTAAVARDHLAEITRGARRLPPSSLRRFKDRSPTSQSQQ